MASPLENISHLVKPGEGVEAESENRQDTKGHPVAHAYHLKLLSLHSYHLKFILSPYYDMNCVQTRGMGKQELRDTSPMCNESLLHVCRMMNRH